MSNDQPPVDDNTGGCAFVIGGVLFIPLSVGSTWYWLFVEPFPQDFVGRVGHLIMVEFTMSWALFFTIGFLWGITGNRHLKKLVDFAAKRVAWILLAILAIALATAAIGCVRILWNQFI